MPSRYLAAVQQPGQTVNPLFSFLGIRAESVSPQRAVLVAPFREGFLQGSGGYAGGIQAALLDEAMAHVVLANLEPGQQTVTMDLHVRYLSPGRREDVRVEAWVVRKGRRVVVVEAEVQGQDGRAWSLATASFMILAG